MKKVLSILLLLLLPFGILYAETQKQKVIIKVYTKNNTQYSNLGLNSTIKCSVSSGLLPKKEMQGSLNGWGNPHSTELPATLTMERNQARAEKDQPGGTVQCYLLEPSGKSTANVKTNFKPGFSYLEFSYTLANCAKNMDNCFNPHHVEKATLELVRK